jgi:nitronate monooxygenase
VSTATGLDTPLTRDAKIAVPLIGGAMYPCSNPELVAAISAAGAIGILQPVSLTYVHGHDYREGIRLMQRLAGGRPIGMNALIEKSSKHYLARMERWVDVALEEGVRFFITSLGNPRWVVDRARAVGGVVYHDITERKWALKAVDAGVQGLIAVNRRAGGHAGRLTPEELLETCGDLGLPLVCAGGVGSEAEFVAALKLGYAGAQLGTRFIATTECNAREDYKQAIVNATEDDIVLTERVTGVPLAVIRTPYIERIGTRIGPVARALFKGRRTKHWMRAFYALRSLRRMKKDSTGTGTPEYWQAGKSVATIHAVEPAGAIVRRFADAARRNLHTSVVT